MIETGYSCKECGAPATLVDGAIVRTCSHTGTVIAAMSAHVTGTGGVAEAAPSALQKLKQTFNALFELAVARGRAESR